MMIRSALTMAAVTLGVAAPVASAHAQPRGYARTYPVAASLCSRVAAGHSPKRIAADTAQITTACGTLADSYTQTLSTYQTTIAPIAGQLTTTLATVRAARTTAEQTHNWTPYKAAVQSARIALKGLRVEKRTAQRTYVTAVRAARHTFWTTIHELPGAGSLPTDTGTPTAPAAPVVPSST